MKEQDKKPKDPKDVNPEELDKETLSNLDDEQLKKIAGGAQGKDAEFGSCIIGSC